MAHPNFENSLANKTIIEEIKKNRNDINIRNIFELYPDFNIDAKAEQEILLQHETIIFQFPFHWYNVPAILKQWYDIVLEYGFAYGSTGDKLKDKNFLLSFTIGAQKEAYQALGYNHFRIPEFLKNLEQTAYLAQMNYLEPIYSHGMVYIKDVYNTPEAVKERALEHSKKLLDFLST